MVSGLACLENTGQEVEVDWILGIGEEGQIRGLRQQPELIRDRDKWVSSSDNSNYGGNSLVQHNLRKGEERQQ